MNLKKLSLVAFVAAAVFATSSAAAFASSAMAESDVKVRDDASKQADWIDTLYAGEIVDVLDCDYGWCYIEHSGPDGWVRENKLDFTFYDYDEVDVGFGIYADGNGVSFGFEISN
jgi:SH3-like domain-containing protein